MYNEWCVDLPGTQSIFNPSPGMNHEWTTSYELAIILMLVYAGKTSVRVVRKSLLARFMENVSERTLLSFIVV
jgi:hypothetical protein